MFLYLQWFFQNIEKAGGNIFFEMILFSQFPQRNISSSFFQYSDKTINITETNDTSTERSNTQLFRVGKSKGLAFSVGLQDYLPQKDIEK